MNKYILLMCCLGFSALLNAQIVNIPDATFKSVLLNYSPAIDTNGDGEIQVTEAEAITGSLSVSNEGIDSLEGIASFTNITFLSCSGNNLTNLDLSENVALEFISANNNNLISIDCSGSPNLVLLNVSENLLETIDLTANPLLDSFSATNNELIALDFSENPALFSVLAAGNEIQTVDVTNSPDLVALNVGLNQITELDLSNNPVLDQLYASTNNLTSLDLRSGGNTLLIAMVVINNPDLTCIQVDDEAFANAQMCGSPEAEWCTDPGAFYSENCGPEPVVFIPDVNFKNRLLNYTDFVIDTNGDDEIQFSEAENVAAVLWVANENIDDLTGIEAFVNLQQLVCSNNNLTSIDASTLVNLEELFMVNNDLVDVNLGSLSTLTYIDASNNPFTTFDVSTILNLEFLQIDATGVTEIDLSNNLLLETFRAQESGLTVLDVSDNTNLIYLDVAMNELESLDLSNNDNLVDVYVFSNVLSTLDIQSGGNTVLAEMIATDNPDLACIKVDNEAFANAKTCVIAGDRWCKDATTEYSETCNPAPIVFIPDANFKAALLSHTTPVINTNGDDEIQISEALNNTTQVFVSGNNIADLTGIEAFENIITLVVADNELSSLDLTSNVLLELVDARLNDLTTTDFTQNAALLTLYVQENLLTELDIAANTSLVTVDCKTNFLTSLDLSSNIALNTFTGSFNEITSLVLGNKPVLETLLFGDNDLATIDLSQCPALEALTLHLSDLASLDVSDNPNLRLLRCYDNELTSLDLSANESLEQLFCYNNSLTSLNLKNGANGILVTMEAENNDGSLCIQVDDEDAATAGTGSYAAWLKDASAVYSESCATAGIAEVAHQEFTFYPNPAKDVLHIQSAAPMSSIEVLNLLGQRVSHKTVNGSQESLDISQLGSGTYFVRIASEISSEVFQIIKE